MYREVKQLAQSHTDNRRQSQNLSLHSLVPESIFGSLVDLKLWCPKLNAFQVLSDPSRIADQDPHLLPMQLKILLFFLKWAFIHLDTRPLIRFSL